MVLSVLEMVHAAYSLFLKMKLGSGGSMADVQVVHLFFATFGSNRKSGIALYIAEDREKQLNALKTLPPCRHNYCTRC